MLAFVRGPMLGFDRGWFFSGMGYLSTALGENITVDLCAQERQLAAVQLPAPDRLHPRRQANEANHAGTTALKIAFLGLGQMGSAMAARLTGAEHELTVWNRGKDAARAMVERGARAADTPVEAAKDADVIFTMLTDDEATKSIVLGPDGFIGSLREGSTHVTLGTISVDLARQLTEAHHAKRQEHLGSPVFGRPGVAADGKLWLAVAGNAELAEKLKPVLDLFSRGMTVVGTEPWQAHALKLGGNFMITATIQMMAEAFVYAEAQGIDPSVFIETVNSALFQSNFVANYAKTMLHPPEHPGATVSLGMKDTRLFREAARAEGVELPLAYYLANRLALAEQAGWQNEDWAVGQYRVARREGRINEKSKG